MPLASDLPSDALRDLRRETELDLTYRLKNFRSFEDTGALDLAPLTVLCGSNSSGKSSILKSMLLLRQSTEFRRARLLRDAPSQPLLFNGELTRLGSWTDVVRGRVRERTVEMAWTAKGTLVEILNDADYAYRRRGNFKVDQNFDASLEVAFRSRANAREELSALLTSSTLTIDSATIALRESSQQDNEDPIYDLSIRGMGTVLSSDIAQQLMTNHRMADLVGLLRARPEEFRLGHVKLEVSGPFISGIRPVYDASWLSFFDRVLQIVQGSRSATPGPKPQWHSRLDAAVRDARAILNSQSELQTSDSKVRSLTTLITAILYDVQGAEERVRVALAPIWKRIRYLGPLRHQPQRFYQFDDTGGIDIGVSGEFTVQVLALEASNTIKQTGIRVDDGGLAFFTEKSTTSLLDATNYWLQYMGLPAVAPDFLRQSLYGLKVGTLEAALPDVGFGVSQVLPVIVEALRATSGDTVLLEQPEIHLHPAVQSKLADFLLCRNVDGVRFLVETHSEYMIKRLCRRYAESTLQDITGLFNIIFVEPNAEGEARCIPLELNEFGEIERWPRGFFDQQEDLYWTRASLKKRTGQRDVQ
jgi:predicted ATPase